MIKTNQEQLVEVSVCGEIAHPEVPCGASLSVGFDGRPFLPVGRGGVVFNVRMGDPAFGWAWGDHVAPGVSISNCCDDANRALVALSCIGNEAVIVDSRLEAKETKIKGATGVVAGKTRSNVIVHFPKKVVERLCVGDRIQIRSSGVGLRLADYPDVSVFNCGPSLLRAINPSEKGGKVRVMVAKLLPGNILGAGIGSGNPFGGDLDLQSVSPEAVKEYSLDTIRLGDLVAISDLDCTNGARWQREAVTVGVIVHGSSALSGHGPGVNVLMTAPKGSIEPIITRKANIAEMLGLS